MSSAWHWEYWLMSCVSQNITKHHHSVADSGPPEPWCCGQEGKQVLLVIGGYTVKMVLPVHSNLTTFFTFRILGY